MVLITLSQVFLQFVKVTTTKSYKNPEYAVQCCLILTKINLQVFGGFLTELLIKKCVEVINVFSFFDSLEQNFLACIRAYHELDIRQKPEQE